MTPHGQPADRKARRLLLRSGETGRRRQGDGRLRHPAVQRHSPHHGRGVDKGCVGHAQTDVIVRDPVVITAGLPRFLAPGDAAVMRLDIANTDAPDGDYQFAVETTGDLSTGSAPLPEKVTLTAGKRQSITVPLIAQTAGDARSRSGSPTRTDRRSSRTCPSRSARQRCRSPTVWWSTWSPTATACASIASCWPKASCPAPMSASASRLRPHLTFRRCCWRSTATLMAAPSRRPAARCRCSMSASWRPAPAWQDDPALRGRIQDAIYRLLNNQSSSGSFGLWGPGSGDLWLDSYVSDFLTRARELNYEVPRAAMLQALNNLQNSLSYDVDIEDRGSEIAYALYVLSRNRRRPSATCAIMPTRSWRLHQPDGVAQLAASLSLYGDSQRPKRPSRRRFSWQKTQPNTTTTARITVRGCATARPCWRWPPKASRCRPSFPS